MAYNKYPDFKDIVHKIKQIDYENNVTFQVLYETPLYMTTSDKYDPTVIMSQQYPTPNSYRKLVITVNNAPIEKLLDIPDRYHRKHIDLDNGLWNSKKDIILKKAELCTQKHVFKKPWFDEVYQTIIKYNPDYTEEELIGSHDSYNWCVIEHVSHKVTEIPALLDPYYQTYTVTVMYDMAREYSDIIVDEINKLLI